MSSLVTKVAEKRRKTVKNRCYLQRQEKLKMSYHIELDTCEPPNIRLINLISKQFTYNQNYTSFELCTWVEQIQSLNTYPLGLVCNVLAVYLGRTDPVTLHIYPSVCHVLGQEQKQSAESCVSQLL